MTDITRVVLAVDSSQVRTATRDLDGMNKTAKATTSTVAGLGKMLAGALGIAGGAQLARQLARQLYQVNAEAQRLKASLITVTGSIGSANAAWAEMEAFARTTPYSLTQAIEGFSKMKALGLDPTTASMTAFGNIAAAMGKDLSQMIEAVADASTSEFERLKEFGIKSKQEGDRVSLTFQGVTTQIGNNSREITKYLEDIGNNQFAGAMERQMDTLGGATSNLGDNFDELIRTIGESGGNDGMIGAINGLSAAIADITSGIENNAEKINGFVDDVVLYARSAKLILEEIGKGTGDDPWYMMPVTRGPAGALYRYLGFGGKQEFENSRDAITDGIANIKKEIEQSRIEKTLEQNAVAADAWMAAQDKLTGAVEETTASTEKFKKSAKDLKDVIGKEVITEVEAAAKEFSKLRDELYPQQAAVRDLMHEYELFSTFAPDALDDWIDKLKVAPDELHRSAEAIDELTEKADPFGKIWDTTIERLQGNIADMFYDMLENGKVTFDGILDMFKRMAAEMAAQKIMLWFSGKGDGGAQGVGQILSAATGGGGAGGIPGIGGAGGLGQTLALAYIGGQIGKAVGDPLGEALFGKKAESDTGAKIGQFFGVVGGMIGSMLDVAFGGDGKKRSALGVSTNATWQGADTVRATSGLSLTAYSKRAGDDAAAAAQQMQQAFLTTDAVLTDVFKMLGTTVDLAGQTLEGKASQYGSAADGFFGAAGYNGLDPADLEGAVDSFVMAWVARANELTGAGIDLAPLIAIQREGELLADVLLRVYNQFGSVNAVLSSINVATYDVSVAGMAAADGLTALFGGLENFTSAASRYYDIFYTEQEKLADIGDKVNDVFAALNLTAPTTLDGFRALVEEYGNMGAAGQETLAALLSVAPAFHQVTTAASAAAAAAEAVAPAVEAISQAMLTLQSQTKALEIELLKAQGLTADAAAAQYALDTEGMTAAEIAVYEYNQAIIAQIEAINAANAAAEDSARLQAAESERAAAEALRIEQQKNAALEAAQQAAAQRAAAIAQERYGLETQLLQLQGNTAELRRRELKELDPSNRALQQQIWALEDQKTAAEAAAQASEQLASTWGNVADNLLAEAKRIRDSAAGDAMSFAGAQAQFAILTAQARAGNMDAAEALPGASQRLLELGMGQARTRADYIRLASATATSLEGTASTITSHDALAKRSAEALEKIQADQRDQLITIQQLTVTTNRLHRIWDDCTQGGTTIRTTETTP